jgi:hypothetical protein
MCRKKEPKHHQGDTPLSATCESIAAVADRLIQIVNCLRSIEGFVAEVVNLTADPRQQLAGRIHAALLAAYHGDGGTACNVLEADLRVYAHLAVRAADALLEELDRPVRHPAA